MTSWRDTHHFDTFVLYVHLLLLMFVGLFVSLFIYSCAAIAISVTEAYERLMNLCNLKLINSVCSLTATSSIFSYNLILLLKNPQSKM